MLRCPASSLNVRSQCSNVFFYETTRPFIVKLQIEHPWEGGTKVCINGHGDMTKMAVKSHVSSFNIIPWTYCTSLNDHIRPISSAYVCVLEILAFFEIR